MKLRHYCQSSFGRELERHFPIVNLAYHAGQGIDYRLNEVLEFAQPGDIVILSIEYGSLLEKVSPIVVWRTIEPEPSNIRFLGTPKAVASQWFARYNEKNCPQRHV